MAFETHATHGHLIEIATEYACSIMDTVLRPVDIFAVLSDIEIGTH